MYFRMGLGDQDKTWAPHSVCRSCVENLRVWTKEYKKKRKKSLRFCQRVRGKRKIISTTVIFVLSIKKLPKIS